MLVCPTSFIAPQRPLLAYDGSQRAAAAMHAAAEFCVSVNLPLTVLTVAKDGEVGERISKDAQTYLGAYKLASHCEAQTGHAPEQIVATLTDGHFDVLFIGAYGHSRILEMVLGSTTEYVLRHSPCPVFLNR